MATVNNWVGLAGRSYIDVVIAAETDESDVIALGLRSIVALQFDADFAGTAVTFECGGAANALAQYDYNAEELSVTVAASRTVGIDIAKTFPMTGFAKLVSGSAQGAGTPSTVRVFAVDW